MFTAVYDEEGTEGRFAHRSVNTSFLQRLRPTARTFRALLPLYPYAMEALDLDALRPRHLLLERLGARRPARRGRGARLLLPQPVPLRVERPRAGARRADGRSAALRCRSSSAAGGSGTGSPPSASTATSRTRRRRRRGSRATSGASRPCCIRRCRPSRFAPGRPGAEYVVLSELMPHKRIDVAVRAFTRLALPLMVIGNGPDARRLRRMAGPDGARSPGGSRDAEVAGAPRPSARARRHRDRGVRDRRGRGAGGRAAGHRAARGRASARPWSRA